LKNCNEKLLDIDSKQDKPNPFVNAKTLRKAKKDAKSDCQNN